MAISNTGSNTSLRSLGVQTYRRFIEAFLISICGGILGVLLDIDHIICTILDYAPFEPDKGIYGCRLYHHIYLYVSINIFSIAITLGIGLLILFMAITFRRTITTKVKENI